MEEAQEGRRNEWQGGPSDGPLGTRKGIALVALVSVGIRQRNRNKDWRRGKNFFPAHPARVTVKWAHMDNAARRG